MAPKTAVIVLNWNNMKDTIDCLISLEKTDYRNFEPIVVDNGSTDGSAAAIRERFPEVRIVETGKNLGFAGGNNAGIRLALQEGFDYVLLLNNDTEADPAFLSELVKVADNDPRIGIAGSKIYYHSEPKKIWFAGGSINYRYGDAHHLGENEMDNGQYDRVSDTDYVTGCSMLIKRKVLEDIGMLEEKLFLYYEDSDFCARASRQGYRIVFVPSSIAWHKISSTTGKIKDLQLFYGTRNMLIFEKRNAGLLNLMVFIPYYFGKFIAYNVMRAILEGRTTQAKVILKAACEGVTK
jgi:GT2 family glycosyltransferase